MLRGVVIVLVNCNRMMLCLHLTAHTLVHDNNEKHRCSEDTNRSQYIKTDTFLSREQNLIIRQPMITFAAIKSSASLSLGVMEHPKTPGELFLFSSDRPAQRFSSAYSTKNRKIGKGRSGGPLTR